jgi:RNA polymerase sigma-70 factor (ECF subfamily)
MGTFLTSPPAAARPSDPAWLARFHAGDRKILEACYRAHYSTVARVVGALVAGRDQDGIVHDVFYRLLTEPGLRASFQGGSLSAWLTTIARNQALNQRRRLARERPLEEAPCGIDEPATEVDLDFRRFVDEFRRDVLPQKLHPVFEVRFLRHLTQREAAAHLGMSRTTLAYQEMQVRRLLNKVLRARNK